MNFFFFQIFYKYCNNIILNPVGHDNRVVKVCYRDSPSILHSIRHKYYCVVFLSREISYDM